MNVRLGQTFFNGSANQRNLLTEQDALGEIERKSGQYCWQGTVVGATSSNYPSYFCERTLATGSGQGITPRQSQISHRLTLILIMLVQFVLQTLMQQSKYAPKIDLLVNIEGDIILNSEQFRSFKCHMIHLRHMCKFVENCDKIINPEHNNLKRIKLPSIIHNF